MRQILWLVMLWVFAAAWTWAAVFLSIMLMGVGLHHLLTTLVGSAVISLPATLGLWLWRRLESRNDIPDL